MFLSSSCLIYERLYLVTLGSTCRYALVSEHGGLTLTDPGASVHVAALEERLNRSSLSLSKLERVLITHLDADRVAGIPLLRRINPAIKVCGTPSMRTVLADEALVQELYEQDNAISSWFNSSPLTPSLCFDEFKKGLTLDKLIAEGDAIQIDDDVTVRVSTTPGHRLHSVSYLVVPHEFAIVDETFGYFRGRDLAAPGGDFDIRQAALSIQKFKDLELSGIGFSYGGAITGALTKRHLLSLTQNTEDLLAEVRKARQSGFTEQEIGEQIHSGFYTTTSQDPCLGHTLERTFLAVMAQLQKITS